MSDDGLDPARGMINGIALSAPIWVALTLLLATCFG